MRVGDRVIYTRCGEMLETDSSGQHVVRRGERKPRPVRVNPRDYVADVLAVYPDGTADLLMFGIVDGQLSLKVARNAREAREGDADPHNTFRRR